MIKSYILILSLFKVNQKMRHQTEEIKLSNILKKKSLTIQCSLRYLVNTECLLQPCTLFIQVLHVRVFVSHQTVQYTRYTLHGAVQWITLVVLIQHFKVYLNVACCVHISFTLYVCFTIMCWKVIMLHSWQTLPYVLYMYVHTSITKQINTGCIYI